MNSCICGESGFRPPFSRKNVSACFLQKRKLHLPDEGEHTWTFRFPAELKGSPRKLFIEEHPYRGPSQRRDAAMVAKSICGVNGGWLASVMGDPDIYLAESLATVSRYDDRTKRTTIKELHAFQLDMERWQLIVFIVWVWRGLRALIGQHARFRNYLPVVKIAEDRLEAMTSEKGKKTIAAGPV